MKTKNEEEKNRLSLELCCNHQFHKSDSSILDHLRYEKNLSKIFIQSKDIKQSLSLVDSKGLQGNILASFGQYIVKYSQYIKKVSAIYCQLSSQYSNNIGGLFTERK